MRTPSTARRAAAVAGAAALVLLLAACDDPPTTVKTTVSFDCKIDANNSLVPDSTTTSTFSYSVTGPQAVAPGSEFDIHVAPDPFTFDGNPTSDGRVTQISNLAWRVAVPANSSIVSTSISDWSNTGPGNPSVSNTSSTALVNVPGPIASSTTANPNVVTLPKLTLHLKATGAVQTRIDQRLAGTSYSAPGLSYDAQVTGTAIGTLDPTLSCFPSPNPTLHSTLISNDTKAPVITIAKPVADQQIVQGTTVLADYSCDDGDGVGVASCAGTVADGTAIDTSSPGAKTFTVTAADKEGKVATASVAYTVVAPG